MSWSTPKTDWKSSDFYSVQDLLRIQEDQEFLYKWITASGGTVPGYKSLGVINSVNTIPYLSTINTLEHNLQQLASAAKAANAPKVHTWYARRDRRYVSNPTYQDWNRWEQTLGIILGALQLADAAKIMTNEFYCGEAQT